MDEILKQIKDLRNSKNEGNKNEINRQIRELIKNVVNLEKVRVKNEKKLITKLRKINKKNSLKVAKLQEKSLLKNTKKHKLFEAIKNVSNENLKEFKLTRNKVLRFKDMDTLIKHINKFKKNMSVDVSIKYEMSGDIRHATITIQVNKFIFNNKILLNRVIREAFYKNGGQGTITGHYGYANILDTKIKGSREINETNISESLMRFSENNDCVFINIFNGIKDYKGYKNYSIDKIKNEFINLGIDITNGVCFNDIKKWIEEYKLHISCYLFAPDFILKDSIKGFRNSNIKIPHLIFMYNNNHCYLINDEEIKNKIIYGKREDISDLNPVSNYKFDSFKNYFKRHFITLKEIIEKGDLDKIEDDVILCEMDESFLKLIHFLVGFDNTQINFIDYKKECILFNGKIIFKVSDYSKRKEICAKLNEIYGVVNFNFENDHYSSIGMKMFKLLNGEIPKSYYNNEVMGLIDNYYIEPCHFGSDNYSELYKNYKYKIGGDCPKSYSNGIYNNFKGVKIPVLSIFDNFIKKDFIINEIYTNLLYLIDSVVYKGIKYTDISLCPYFIVKKLLEKGVVVKCLGYIKCSKYYDGTKLCNFVSECYNLLEPKDAKNIVNCVAGLFNKKWKNDNKGFITKDHDIVNNALLEGYDISWEGDEDRIYVAKWKGMERINGDYNLIHQSIIWGGVLNLFELIDKVDIRI